jgi:hypothetical protein
MIDKNIVTYIKGLNTAAASRVHTGNIPQGSTLPAIVINRLPGTTPRTTNNTPLASRTPFTIGVVANEFSAAMPVAVQLRGAFDGFHGTMPHDVAELTDPTDTQVFSARCTSEPTYFDEIDGDKTLRAISQDFFFVHSEI